MSTGELDTLLSSNILDIQFNRRTLKKGYSPTRRMLCTTNPDVLNSLFGRVTLKFNPPKGVGMKFDPASRGLVVCWDIMWQDWRLIPAESKVVIGNMPIDKAWDQKIWMAKFLLMTPSQKKRYMGG